MPLQKILDGIRQSLWFVPAIWVVLCGAAAFGMVALDAAAPDVDSQLPLVFGGGPEGARGLLSAIASSMITVVGVVFSITIVALQLASSQYSPRVLRNFMRDRASQITLGSFIGVFVYSLLVLRTVRSEADGRDEFVPAFAVTGAVILAIVAVGMLVYFIHHIATRMQVSYITAAVARETIEEIDRQAQARQDHGAGPDSIERPDERGVIVRASQSGYLQYVETDKLVELARERDLVIRVTTKPGAWVQRHAPLFEVWGDDGDGLEEELRDLVSVGDERVVFQDPQFGLQQLVDIAVKALSPGVNDPTTARNALHRIVEILVAAGRARLTAAEHRDAEGRIRVWSPRPDFAELLRVSFEEVHHFGHEIPSVTRSIGEALDAIASAVGPDCQAAIDELRRGLGQSSSSAIDPGP